MEEYSDYKCYLMVESPCQQSGHCILHQLWLSNHPTASMSHCHQVPDRAMAGITGKKKKKSLISIPSVYTEESPSYEFAPSREVGSCLEP